MAKRCQLSGKRPMAGNTVSHANNKRRRRQLPNLHSKRIYVPELDRWVRVRLSTRALRTVTKKGLMSYLASQGMSIQDVV
jgi:large subunit ribosomal protein L28